MASFDASEAGIGVGTLVTAGSASPGMRCDVAITWSVVISRGRSGCHGVPA
jgi:hypothetical protein